MSYPATFVDLQNAVIDKARLGSTTADTNRVKDWVNSAYAELCIETNFYEASAAASALSANVTSVAVPSSVIKIEYIIPTASDGTVWGPMTEVTFEEVLELRAWQGGVVSTGAPSRYAHRSSGAPTIEFYPQAVGGEVLTFYGLLLPTALSGSSDAPIIPGPYREAITYGALVHAAEFKKDLLMLNQFQQQKDVWTQRLRGFVNTGAGTKVQQMRVEGSRLIPRRNDIDQGI